jgi:large subunit ribosomal protein L25
MEMTEDLVLKLDRRDAKGTRAARRLRREGRIPVVLYGHGQESLTLAASAHDLAAAVATGHKVFDLEVDGKREKGLLKDLQYEPLGIEILHADFTRVAADERVTISVPLRLVGTPVGVTQEEGVLHQTVHELEIECLALEIPEEIKVQVSELALNDSIAVKDLELPHGVTTELDPETAVCTVSPPALEEEEEAPAEGEVEIAAEPEVIGRKPEEEAEEEGGETE